jgi:hypothetical protein
MNDFVGQNIIIIGIVLLAAFGYLIILIRKRWKHGFLHKSDPGDRQ